jgi:catechol 2,3-dioxygenase-like lactoylglutathione lyase family enzyme
VSSAAHAGLAAELYVSELARSLRFYVDLLGFVVSYERPEQRFAAISLGAARIMLEQLRATASASPEQIARGEWRPAALERPFGRGINLEIPCADVAAVAQRLAAAGWPALVDLHEKSYRAGNGSVRVRQLVVADPDGYLIRPSQRLEESA